MIPGILSQIHRKTVFSFFRICEILDVAWEGTSFLNGHLASEACLSSSWNHLLHIHNFCSF